MNPSQPMTGLGAALPTEMKRRPVVLSDQETVTVSDLIPGCALPALVRPNVSGVGLVAWAKANRTRIAELLDQRGALLFRGFRVDAAGDFETYFNAVTDGALPYKERSSPRLQVAGNIYTSTEHPPNYEIFAHNEQSYNRRFASKIAFFCHTAARSGGETPLTDTRKVFARIRADLREEFIRRRYMYVRNFGDGFGLTWQNAFQTDDKTEVERYCQANDIQVEWKSGNRLRTRQVRRVALKHPRTGEDTWFNHFTFFHITTLEPEIQSALRAEFTDTDLPNNTYFGDGERVSDEIVEELRAAYRAETVRFPWQEGDVVLVDNLIVAHGRASFTGARKVLVAMGEPLNWDDMA